MSLLNPEPNLIHIMGCYVLGNANGEKVDNHICSPSCVFQPMFDAIGLQEMTKTGFQCVYRETMYIVCIYSDILVNSHLWTLAHLPSWCYCTASYFHAVAGVCVRKTGGSVVRVGQGYDGRRWGCQIWQATALWLRDRQSVTPPPPHFSAAYTLTHAHTLTYTHTQSLSGTYWQ